MYKVTLPNPLSHLPEAKAFRSRRSIAAKMFTILYGYYFVNIVNKTPICGHVYNVYIFHAQQKSKNPRNYWVKFKKRHDELVTICHQLKLKAKDGKFYNTDVVDDRGLNTVKNERRGHVGPFVTLCWSPIITERPAAVPCNGRFC